MLSKEELLKPRIKILNDWPGVTGKVIPGKIISVDDEFEEDMFWIGGIPFLIDKIRDYPYLFKELEWCEDREEKDMPKYVSVINAGLVNKKDLPFFAKVSEVYNECPFLNGFRLSDGTDGMYTAWRNTLPATQEEYEDYLNRSTQPNASHS